MLGERALQTRAKAISVRPDRKTGHWQRMLHAGVDHRQRSPTTATALRVCTLCLTHQAIVVESEAIREHLCPKLAYRWSMRPQRSDHVPSQEIRALPPHFRPYAHRASATAVGGARR